MGEFLDQLMDVCHDAGWPAPRYGRLPGTRKYWVSVYVPGEKQPFERHGASRDEAALEILLEDLTMSVPEAQAA